MDKPSGYARPTSLFSSESVSLRHILKRVSRSFYLSLIILPKAVRQPIGLAYLFCRAADTITDTHILPPDERRQALDAFRHQFQSPPPQLEALDSFKQNFIPYQASPGESQLLQSLPECFALFATFPPNDQALIRNLVLTLTKGMEMDLTYFPTDVSRPIQALPTATDLDQYTYYVAGVVGEFWTRMHASHFPALQRGDVDRQCQRGIRFGKGLQMTNILKDIAHDLTIGRCYLPATELNNLKLNINDLCYPKNLKRARPLLDQLTHQTLVHLDEACAYINELPRGMMRLRLSCMWPLLFAIKTLRLVHQSPDLLSPKVRVKISRGEVYRIMVRSLWYLAYPPGLVAYYNTLRSELSECLAAGTRS